MPRAIATTDHQTIRHWIEARNGHPSVVKSTEQNARGKAGLLRVDFNKPEDTLEEVSWDEFFETFDENRLAFLYQEKTASGRKSRFNKFVNRESVDTQDTEDDASSMHASGNGEPERSASAMQEEAEEIDEEDAFEEDEDLRDDER